MKVISAELVTSIVVIVIVIVVIIIIVIDVGNTNKYIYGCCYNITH